MICQLRHLVEKSTTTLSRESVVSPPLLQPPYILVAFNLSSKVIYPGIRGALGLGTEQEWAKTGVSSTGDFLAVLGKLVVETALSKW